MTYRVLNVKTGEIVAEFSGISQFEYAMRLADDLAHDAKHREQFVVVQTTVVYETPIVNNHEGGTRP